MSEYKTVECVNAIPAEELYPDAFGRGTWHDHLLGCKEQVDTTQASSVSDDWIREHFRCPICGRLMPLWGPEMGPPVMCSICRENRAKAPSNEPEPEQPREPKRMWGDVYVDSNGSLECTACVSREEYEEYFHGECYEFREVLRDENGKELPTKAELQAGELILSLTQRIREHKEYVTELQSELIEYKQQDRRHREQIAKQKAENERISRYRESYLNAACYWWMTYHDAMGIVRPNAMSEGIQEAVAKIESERKRLKELEVENSRSKELLNAGSVIVEDCNRAMELLNAHGSQDGTMLEKVAAMVDENERLKAKVRESDDQFSRIAKVLGGDATDAPESDRTVAGFVIQRFADERRAHRGDKAELEELRNAMQCVLMGDEYGGCACPSLIADVAFGRARQAREKAEADEAVSKAMDIASAGGLS